MLHWFRFRPSGFLGLAATFFLVVVGWVIFRTEVEWAPGAHSKDVPTSIDFLSIMFGITHGNSIGLASLANELTPDRVFAGAFGLLFAWFPIERLNPLSESSVIFLAIARRAGAIGVLVLSLAWMSDASFNPFIYFRF